VIRDPFTQISPHKTSEHKKSMADSSLSDTEKPYQDGIHTEHQESGVITSSTPVKNEGQWNGPDADFSGIDRSAVLRKMDMRLIPVLALLYLLSFLDRG
jgi:hypothetical protein